ncbi:MAG: hypothetical protein U1F01_01450 [Acinetobacter sp.]
MASKIIDKSELRTFNMQSFIKVANERITVDVNSFDLEDLVEKEHEMLILRE